MVDKVDVDDLLNFPTCDICGEVKSLHNAGDYDICDECEKRIFHQEEE